MTSGSGLFTSGSGLFIKNGSGLFTKSSSGLSTEPPELSRANKALLDPPRSGAAGFVKALATSHVERVVYISCNPETLSRDIALLVNGGFDFKAVGIVDMFPHTMHIESIALLVRPGPNRG